MDNLYEHIEKLAKDRGYKNITEFCRAAEIPRATMSELKTGRTKRLSADTLSKIASNLSVSVDYLLGRTDDPIDYEHDADLIASIPLSYLEACDGDVRRAFAMMAAADEDAAKEKAPADPGKRSVSDDDIKFALFGGDGEITDAMYDEVRRFAAFVKQREAEKKKE